MSKMHLVLVSAGTALILGLQGRAIAGNRPVIEAIEGDKVVVVQTPQGNRVGMRGTEISFGDRIKTGPFASAKILYPDGSKLLIGRGTDMAVLENEGGTQYNELKTGEVRGIIKKAKPVPGGQATPAVQKTPPRFVVRTKTAVMGVRGTDFVFNLDEATTKAEVHTLDGTVEVAKTEKALMEGQGVPVPHDQFISTDAAAKVLNTPQGFDRRQFVATLETAQPEFVALVRNDPDAISRDGISPEMKQEDKMDPALRLLTFRVNGLYIKQDNSSADLTTLQVSWAPSLRLFGPLSVGGIGSLFPLKGRSKDDTFYGMELSVFASLRLFKVLMLEAGAGAQGWYRGRTSPGPVGNVNIAFKLSKESLIERIFVGAGHYKPGQENNITRVPESNELRAGLGFQL